MRKVFKTGQSETNNLQFPYVSVEGRKQLQGFFDTLPYVPYLDCKMTAMVDAFRLAPVPCCAASNKPPHRVPQVVDMDVPVVYFQDLTNTNEKDSQVIEGHKEAPKEVHFNFFLVGLGVVALFIVGGFSLQNLKKSWKTNSPQDDCQVGLKQTCQ